MIAKRFLLDFVEQAPFPILSLQVDGGSEFMAEFEETCAELGIPLIVLPPKKPEYMGSIRGIQAALSKALTKYNTYRPHRNLKGLTPYGSYQ